jgi:hypothetical protein
MHRPGHVPASISIKPAFMQCPGPLQQEQRPFAADSCTAQQQQQQQCPLMGDSICQQPGSPACNALQQCSFLQQDHFFEHSQAAGSSSHEDDTLMDFWVLLQQTQHNLQVMAWTQQQSITVQCLL